MTSRLRKGLAAVSLVVLLAPFLTGFDDFREEVFACEEAVAHLAQCCPAFDAVKLDCHYEHSSGCGFSDAHDPALSNAESTCIRAMSCGELVAAHVCDRAQVAPPYVSSTSDGDMSRHVTSTHAPVCP